VGQEVTTQNTPCAVVEVLSSGNHPIPHAATREVMTQDIKCVAILNSLQNQHTRHVAGQGATTLELTGVVVIICVNLFHYI